MGTSELGSWEGHGKKVKKVEETPEEKETERKTRTLKWKTLHPRPLQIGNFSRYILSFQSLGFFSRVFPSPKYVMFKALG